MKKIILSVFFLALLILPGQIKAADWSAVAPEGFKSLDWAKARGVSTFYKAQDANGYLDYLTIIYLPYSEVKLIASSTPELSWGEPQSPFDSLGKSVISNWVFSKMVTEQVKIDNPDAKFFWNMPYFNVNGKETDLSLSLKSTSGPTPYITSGSRPEIDTKEKRKMLIVNNAIASAQITDFDANTFVESGDQAVEGFAPEVTAKGTSNTIARLFVGVRNAGKELVIYCSRGATIEDASNALMAAGVPMDNQIQVDGGASATCAYNMPGQYFVEPGRMLPHLMGAFTKLQTGTVLSDRVNVRRGPGLNYPVATQFNKGKIVIYEVKGDWVRVTESGQWVYKPLVALD